MKVRSTELANSLATGPIVLPEPLSQPARLVSPYWMGLSRSTISRVTPSAMYRSSSPSLCGASKEKRTPGSGCPYGGPEQVVVTSSNRAQHKG